jgi:hypothetical protein
MFLSLQSMGLLNLLLTPLFPKDFFRYPALPGFVGAIINLGCPTSSGVPEKAICEDIFGKMPDKQIKTRLNGFLFSFFIY